uniref:Neurocan core protein n=1 Tax=Anolis carolinensis TaxID=28377 RepID=H9GPN6_ANOCA
MEEPQLLGFLSSRACSQDNGKVIHINKVHHQPLRVGLSEPVALPCLFLLQPPTHLSPNEAADPPRIKWSKVQSASGQPEDISVLVAKDNVVKVSKGYEGRISLPGYPHRRYNATLLLSAARASDAGLYRCEVVAGIHDEQDLVPLEVTGVVFHYRAASNRYALTFPEAQRACEENSAVMASPDHLQAAFEDGYDNCDAGWLSDHTVRYPITLSRPGCYGDRNSLPGVRSYGERDGTEAYDVYCYARELQGRVFYASSPGRMTFPMAQKYCLSRGAQLATTGQLYLAWKEGLDQCDPGWLADGSARYPIRVPRKKCGGDEPGVRTAYQFPNRTGFPNPSSKFDAYCYKGIWICVHNRHHWGAVSFSVEHDSDVPLLVQNELFPKENEEAIISGDSKEPYSPFSKAGVPLLEDDEQLQLVTAFPDGTWDGKDEREVETSSPVYPGDRYHVVFTEKSTSVDPTQGTSPLVDESEDEVTDVVPHETASPQFPTSAFNPTSHTGQLTTEGSSALAESTRRSIYSGLNGRYFQRRREDEVDADEEAEGSTHLPTLLPVLALAVHRIVDNSIEAAASADHGSTAALRSGPSYALSNEVEGNTTSLLPFPTKEVGEEEQPMTFQSTQRQQRPTDPNPTLLGSPRMTEVEEENDGYFHPSSLLPMDADSGSGEEKGEASAVKEDEGLAWSEEANVTLMADTDPCDNDPCLHGGTCQSNGNISTCNCPRGFTGENCEIDIDDCLSSPCQNGGTCIDEINAFVCLCLPSYGGNLCERDTEGCDHNWHKFQGHCYRYFAHRRSWEDEHNFINGFGHENTWIGLNDRIVEQDFQWTDNSGLQYENWRENQPDNFFAGGEDCVVLVSHETGKWNDVPCNYNLPYVCKKDTVLCGPPPAVENAFPIGKKKEKYSVHATVRYQCEEGFLQRHLPTIKCHVNGTWDRPRVLCTKPRRSHRTRRHHRHRHRQHHRHKSRKDRRKHSKQQQPPHPKADWNEDDGNYF